MERSLWCLRARYELVAEEAWLAKGLVTDFELLEQLLAEHSVDECDYDEDVDEEVQCEDWDKD